MHSADDVLEDLAKYASDFVMWLEAEEPLVRAYTACILANIAFLEPGQQQVLEARGIAPLMLLLKTKKEDTKVTLHSTAAIQNLTYKNTACCSEVIECGGEKALKNLLQHKKEDVQQFAAGALANLQLYKRKEEASEPLPKSKKGMMNRMLRRKGKAADSPRGPSGSPGMGSNESGRRVNDAAVMIQAHIRAKQARADVERRRGARKGQSKTNRYKAFNVADVRNELNNMPPLGQTGGGMSQLGRLPNSDLGLIRKPGVGMGLQSMGGAGMGVGARPAGGRLAPLGGLPPLGAIGGSGGGGGLAPMAPMAPMGGLGGLGPPRGMPPPGISKFGSGFNAPMGPMPTMSANVRNL